MSICNTSREKSASSPEAVGSPLGALCSDDSEVLQAASFRKICHMMGVVMSQGKVLFLIIKT